MSSSIKDQDGKFHCSERSINIMLYLMGYTLEGLQRRPNGQIFFIWDRSQINEALSSFYANRPMPSVDVRKVVDALEWYNLTLRLADSGFMLHGGVVCG